MFKKCLSLSLVGLLVAFSGPAVFATTAAEKDARRIEKVRTAILSLGTGLDTRIKVTLNDKTKLAGFIREADDVHFVVADVRTGTDTSVSYPQVKSVQGQNLNKGAKIAIGAGIATGIIVLVLFLIWHGHFSPGHG